MFYLNDTKEKHYKSIENLAKDSFKDHILIPEQEEGPIRMWLCRNKNGSGIYSFRVVSGPTLLAVYGDVGDNILRVHGSNTIGWIRGAKNSTDYVIEKIQNKQEHFMPGEALALLDWEIESAGDDEEEIKIAKEFVEKVKEEWSEYSREEYNSESLFIDAWHNAGGESECLSNAYDWNSDIYWTVMCLRKFVELYDKKYSLASQDASNQPKDGACSSFTSLDDSAITPTF